MQQIKEKFAAEIPDNMCINDGALTQINHYT